MNIPEAVRLRIYQVLVALQALVVGYNVIAPDQAALWVNLVSAALGLGGAGLAAVNTPAKPADMHTALLDKGDDA